MKLAILGASGFVGSRVVECFHLSHKCEVCPIVRSYRGLSRLARFDLDWRLADARDERALEDAFSGCDVVLHSVAGDAQFIHDSAIPAYRAAVRKNVRRMVFLSSAVVHGQKPIAGTTEDSTLALKEPLYNKGYNRAKIFAERSLLKQRSVGTTELVILRPSIVFGPRAHWIYKTAQRLLEGTFAWVNRGQGICNSIYVDNLVEAIHKALIVPDVDGEAFLIGDRETVTWADLYGPIAKALGFELEEIPDLSLSQTGTTWREVLEGIHGLPPVQSLIHWLPGRFKRAVKAGLYEWVHPPVSSAWEILPAHVSQPMISPEEELLYRCDYRLPNTKAEQHLGYSPPVSFKDGLGRSIGWLGTVGYPVR